MIKIKIIIYKYMHSVLSHNYAKVQLEPENTLSLSKIIIF